MPGARQGLNFRKSGKAVQSLIIVESYSIFFVTTLKTREITLPF